MGGLAARSRAPCTLLLLLSAVLPHAAAMFQGDGKREHVHKVYKVKITEDHLTQDFHLEKRAKDQCPTNYSLCPPSLGGNCCPNNYACAKESCYATTAAVSTCAGQASYYACPLDVGGGCCPQGLVCGANEACSPPVGATYSQTCATGYSLCAASLGGGCCQSGMACGSTACYNASPSTSVIVVATTQGSSATTITSTSVFTPTADSSDTGADVVAKIFPSTAAKEDATEGDDSSGGGGSSGLSKGAIGGIVGGAAALLVIFLAVAWFLVKRLNKTKHAVESRRETTSGSGTRQTGEKKSATVSVARIQPTPSEVDEFDCDPLMVPSSSVASPRGQHQHPRPGNGRSRSDSDALSQPSGYSSSAGGQRWNTPSINSDGGNTSYFSLPGRVHNQYGDRDGRRASEVSSQYSYHRFVHGHHGRHGRNHSNASELSAGSDELGSSHGLGSPLIGPTAVELSNECGFVPELPGSDTETESNGPHGANGRRGRRSTGVVSPMSTTGTCVNKPPLTHANLAGRRRGSSTVSSMDGQNGNGGRGRSDSSTVAPESRLGSIDESATAAAPATNSMHGYFGSPTTAVGQTAAGARSDFDTPPLPGFVSLGPPPSGNHTGQEQDEK